ncbi:MAG TPA: hypothetical protein PKE64_26055 [Anaerolineae bacterium]|nr:hypothetical protein [Anaerolineae bacterium]HMR67492.1 hypothetical protein [Anaerolineae bacterium]
MTISKRISDHVLAAHVAINNALADDDIIASLSLYGYDEARLRGGQELLSQVEELRQDQKVGYGEQYDATASFKLAWAKANEAYKHALKLARITFKTNAKARAALLLDGKRHSKFSNWLEQAGTFYANLLGQPDLLAAMSHFGYDRHRLETEQALVEAVAENHRRQEVRRGDAHHGTAERNAALNELNDWMMTFRAAATVALADRPQQLEKLGFGNGA